MYSNVILNDLSDTNLIMKLTRLWLWILYKRARGKMLSKLFRNLTANKQFLYCIGGTGYASLIFHKFARLLSIRTIRLPCCGNSTSLRQIVTNF